MSGVAEGLFTLLRAEDEAKRHILIVRCDLCRTGEGFDERLARPNPEAKMRAIMEAHVCIDMRERPKPQKPRHERTYNRLEEVTFGELKKRLARLGVDDE